MNVIKRSGKLERFDPAKIKKAILMAFNEVNEPSSEVDNILSAVISNLPATSTVDQIQDQVEQTLMAYTYYHVAKAYIQYRLSKNNLREVNPDPMAISDYIFYSKYSKSKNNQSSEQWFETIDRVAGMYNSPSLSQHFLPCYTKHFLPSMRSLQFAGPAINQHHARMYNCSGTLLDHPDRFSQIFYLLLCGCGVGVSVEWEYVDQLPVVNNTTTTVVHHIIEDSIYGWCKAVDVLINSYFDHNNNPYVEFSYHQIRPKGSPLVTSGGLAPGHLPLKTALESIRTLLSSCSGRNLRPIECFDLICLLAQAVLSGGIRRSSIITLFSPTDTEMLYAKHGDWYTKYPYRAMSNNSVVIKNSSSSRWVFDKVVKLSADWGEPGFFFQQRPNTVTNPCGEIVLDPRYGNTNTNTNNTNTKFGFCNLVEINMAQITSEDEFYRICSSAAHVACHQATFDQIIDHNGVNLHNGEYLIGVSLTGIFDCPTKITAQMLENGREIIKSVAKEMAVTLNIPINHTRCTCIKPSGTASLVLGNVSNGIHPHYSKRYFRRVTANNMEPAFKYFSKFNPLMIEQKNANESCIVFPVKVKEGSEYSLTLDLILFYRKHWIGWEKGGELVNNISCSYQLGSGSNTDINTDINTIYSNQLTIALIPPMVDKKYQFAPKEAVITPVDEARYRELINSYTPVDWTGYQGMVTDYGAACEGDRCTLDPQQ